jgi:hypothetical protein
MAVGPLESHSLAAGTAGWPPAKAGDERLLVPPAAACANPDVMTYPLAVRVPPRRCVLGHSECSAVSAPLRRPGPGSQTGQGRAIPLRLNVKS